MKGRVAQRLVRLLRPIGRWWMAALASADLMAVVFGLTRYPTAIRLAAPTVVWACLLLLGCVLVGVVAPRWPSPLNPDTLRSAGLIGLGAGGVWVFNLAGETYASLPTVVSLVAFATVFALFAIAGTRAFRRSGQAIAAYVATVWTATISVLILIAFGLALNLVDEPRLATLIARDPRGALDLRTFTWVNTLDAASSHLTVAPVVAVILTAIALVPAMVLRSRRPTMTSG